MVPFLAVLAAVLLLGVVALVLQRRARATRPAVVGGDRRDYFGDRLTQTDAPR